jgi:hypothetical protein
MKRYDVHKICLTLGILLIALSTVALSSETGLMPGAGGKDQTPGVTAYLTRMQSDGRAYLQSSSDDGRPPSIDMSDLSGNAEKYKTTKSPLKAFIYSAVVPGAGQLYTGSKFKAAIFLGLEALTWTGQIVYHNKGNDKTDAFNIFADTHWSEERYGDFIYRNWPPYRDDEDVYVDGYLVFTHHLPDTKTQQYYEMIGKYDQFVFGWDDVDTIATAPTYDNLDVAYSAHRMHYEDMRHDANKMFDRSTSFLIATMANHLIAGVEAALAARRHNNKVDDMGAGLSFRADVDRINDEYFPTLTMTYSF